MSESVLVPPVQVEVVPDPKPVVQHHDEPIWRSKRFITYHVTLLLIGLGFALKLPEGEMIAALQFLSISLPVLIGGESAVKAIAANKAFPPAKVAV